jgi:alkylation response protein AidB-like acyl-CoA dehydrogenase
VPGGVVLGEPGGGWGVSMATTGSERGLTLRSPGRFLATAARLVGLYRSTGCRDPLLRRRIADAWMKAEAYPLQTLQTVTALAVGGRPGAESSLVKLWWSELDLELHEVALDVLGDEAERDGPWAKGWQFALAGPIYAGTNEIQRNIAAERLLGLPRR